MKLHVEKMAQFLVDPTGVDPALLDPNKAAYFVGYHKEVRPNGDVVYGKKVLATLLPETGDAKIRVPRISPGDNMDNDDNGDMDEVWFGKSFFRDGIFPTFTREWFIVMAFGGLPESASAPYLYDASRDDATKPLVNGWWKTKLGIRRVV